MSRTANDDPRPPLRTRLGLRLGIGAAAALLVLVMVGLVYYWVEWSDARGDRRDQYSRDYLAAQGTFLEAIDAERLDAAYQSTTPSYQGRVSRDEFAERARRYLAFKRKPGAGQQGGRASGPIGGDHTGPNRMAVGETWADTAGNRLQLSMAMVFEDSILYRRPPAPRVGEFAVEVSPAAPGKP